MPRTMPRTTPISPGRTPGSTTADCPGLRAAIEDAGLSITDAARLIHAQRTRVANWITRARARRVELERLCRAIDKHLGQPLGTSLEAACAPERDPLREAIRRLSSAEAAVRDASARLQLAESQVAEARAAVEKLKTGP